MQHLSKSSIPSASDSKEVLGGFDEAPAIAPAMAPTAPAATTPIVTGSINLAPESAGLTLVPQDPQKDFPGFSGLPQLGHAAGASGIEEGIADPHFPQNLPFDSWPQLEHVMILQGLFGWVYLTAKECQQCSAVRF